MKIIIIILGGKPNESLFSFEKTDNLCAEPIANMILSKLKEYDVDDKKMIAQCYDGASVMSGEHAGIQQIIQQRLKRKTPYIHCVNHRLHLKIVAAIDNVQGSSLFFGQVKMLYNFFSRFKIKQVYEGTNIAKVIEISIVLTRWSGHKRAIDAIFSNYKDILSALNEAKSGTKIHLDGEDVATAIGISKAIQEPDFIFMLLFLKELLDIVEPVNKMLQSREMSYRTAMPLINVVIDEIKKLKTDDHFEILKNKAGVFSTENISVLVSECSSSSTSIGIAC